MELKNIIKRAPLALIIVGITMLAMNPKKRPLEAGAQSSTAKIAHTQTQPQTPIKVITYDEQEVEIPRNLAFESSMLKNIVADTGQSTITLNLTAHELSSIFNILRAINAAPDAVKFKRDDGKYIAQGIQPIIDQALFSADTQTLAQLIYTAEFLDIEQITNGAIRVLVQKTLAIFPMATIASIKDIWTSYNILWPVRLDPILEYQYQLVANGNIPELSVKDYIAIHGMPEVREGTLNLERSKLTSLEGLNEITNIANARTIDLAHNPLTRVPTNIFNGLTNLESLYLNDNQLETFPATIFNGLTNLQELDISSNDRLTTLPAQLLHGLTNLWHLYINYNQLTTLPAGLFNGLTNLRTIRMNDNELTSLPAELFNGLTRLDELALHRNKLTSLPDVIFNGLIDLRKLYMHENELAFLPERLFRGRIRLQALYINSNELTSLPVGIFYGLLNLQAIYLNDNQLESLPNGIFNDLGALREIRLENNKLTSLPRTIFSASPQFGAPFPRLQALDLSDNPGFEHITQEEFRERYNIVQDAAIGLGSVDFSK